MLSILTAGTEMSLAEARDRGASVDFFYNPEDALKKAEEEKETIFVLAAVGFETTAPIWATVVKEADERHISNLKLLTALKTMPETLGELCTAGNIDGFLCPAVCQAAFPEYNDKSFLHDFWRYSLFY